MGFTRGAAATQGFEADVPAYDALGTSVNASDADFSRHSAVQLDAEAPAGTGTNDKVNEMA